MGVSVLSVHANPGRTGDSRINPTRAGVLIVEIEDQRFYHQVVDLDVFFVNSDGPWPDDKAGSEVV